MELSGRKALVVGLGKSGLAAARLLLSRGARVAVTDGKPEAELAGTLSALGPLDGVHLGGIPAEAFAGRDLVVVSPGVPLTLAPLREAKARGVEVIGEIKR